MKQKTRTTLAALVAVYTLTAATVQAYAETLEEETMEAAAESEKKQPDITAKLQEEVYVNNTGVLNDAKLLLLIGDDVKFRYFTRDRFTLTYDGTPQNVWLQSWGIAKGGLRIDGQLRIANDQPSAWVGVGYDGKEGDLFGLVEGYVTLQQTPIAELNTAVAYSPELGKGHKLKLEYQGLHWFNKGTPFSGTGRVRIGYSPMSALTLGVGTEFTYGTKQEPTINVGGFVRMEE